MAHDGILLESGTNEVELIEFLLGGQHLGVNVAKIQAIEQWDPAKVTDLPLTPPAMRGVWMFRQRTIPLIDLATALDLASLPAGGQSEDAPAKDESSQDERIVMVMEFNGVTTAFAADGVTRIHRVSWEAIQPLSPVIVDDNASFTGSVHLEDREVLIADMEKILATILPRHVMPPDEVEQLPEAVRQARAGVRIVLAEDSATIRAMLTEALHRGGYTTLTAFDTGRAAYEAVEAFVRAGNQAQTPDVLISDIEMPQMDGLTLCRRVKQDLGLAIPVVMFSSLINEQMAAKCRSVGADACISKPQFSQLTTLLDELCLQATSPA